MSCVETATRFRLLDGNVGWDHAESDSATHGVAGMHDDAGLRLETVDRERIGSDRLSPYMPPPWLAQGCGPCQWYLLTPGSCEPQVSRAQRCDEAAAPNTLGPGVLRRDPCNGLWTEVFPPPASDVQLRRPVAIAVRGSRLAVADEAAGKVFVWSIPDRRLGAVIDVEAPTAVAFAPWGDLLVAISAEVAARTPKQSAPNSSPPDTQVNVARFSPTGEPRGRILFDAKGRVQRLAAGGDCAVWVAIGDPVGPFDLHRIVLDDIDQPVNQNEERPNGGEHLSSSSKPMPARQCCPPDEFKIEKITGQALEATLKRLAEAFRRSGLVAVSAHGFCLEEPGLGADAAHGSIAPGDTVIVAKQGAELRVRNQVVARLDRGTRLQVYEAVCDRIVVRVLDDSRKLGGAVDKTHVNRLRADGGASPRIRCFLRDGKTAPRHVATPRPAPAPSPSNGTLTTTPIDSGIPRCQWHRLRVEAQIPSGTSVSIDVTTLEDRGQTPHDDDWQELPANVTDALIDQPPGRYLLVRIKLVGNERRTPIVRRVRLDFPRVTSLEHLPAVYRENPEAEDFTERFLSLFDASIEEIDRIIERFPALLDPGGVPDDVLPWLGAFLDVALDAALDNNGRRRLLLEVPKLYRQRGTIPGLIRMVELVFGVRPAIDERFLSRSWAAVGRDAHVGFARLFGRRGTRFRLNRSSLGGAPLRSFGNPDHDPFATDAYRFTVRIPPTPTLGLTDVRRLNRLIAREKPAHTVHALHVGGQGFVVGPWSALGIDPAFGTTEAPVLGGRSTAQPGTVRLNRISVLRSGPYGCAGSLRVGEAAAVGIHTVLE